MSVALTPKQVDLVASIGRGVLALIAARLAFSMFERGNELGGILMVAVTIVGAVLSLRDLNLYRQDQRTEQTEV